MSQPILSVRGRPVSFASPGEARAGGIETINQDLARADNLDVGANVFLGREPMRRILGLFPALDRARMPKESAALIATLDIALPRLDLPVRSLSGGQRQAVAIGRAS